jgi:hypothetical protein
MSSALHRLGIHAVEGVHAFLLFGTEAAPLVAARMQVLLHRFADPHIFALNLVAELDGLFRRFAAQILLRQIPLKDGEAPVRLDR